MINSTRLEAFARFAGLSVHVIKTRRRDSLLPFHSREKGEKQMVYGPEHYLAWTLYLELIEFGFTMSAAASAVRNCEAAEAFLSRLNLGDDCSRLLFLTRSVSVGNGEVRRESALLDPTAQALHDLQISSDSVTTVQMRCMWRRSVRRAREVGIRLLPGAVLEDEHWHSGSPPNIETDAPPPSRK